MEVLDEHLAESKIGIKNNSQRAQYIIYVFWGICLIDVVAIISGYFEMKLLERALTGDLLTDSEATANDLRQGVVGLMQMVLYIASIVLFLNWFRRAYGNLHRTGRRLQHNETMAIWSFFIPVISLFRPYQIAKEIYYETQRSIKELIPEYKVDAGYTILAVWWALFIITNYIGQFAFKSLMGEDTIEQLVQTTKIYMVSDFMDIPAAIATIFMIKKVAGVEATWYDELGSRPSMDSVLEA